MFIVVFVVLYIHLLLTNDRCHGKHICEEELLDFSNQDVANILTPVKPDLLKELLEESSYHQSKTKYLVSGFSEGFDICYEGQTIVRKLAPNLKLRVGSKRELWNKVMVEVRDGRFAGPIEEVPFEHYIQSPIVLVLKDKGKKTRLIFQLSYPRDGE